MARHPDDVHVLHLFAERGAVPVIAHHPHGCTLDTCPVIDRIATAIVLGAPIPPGDGTYNAWFDLDGTLRLHRTGPLPSTR